MGSLTPRIRQGLINLVGATAVVAVLFWAVPSLRVLGELWVVLGIAFVGTAAWEGFRADPPRRAYAEVLRTRRLVLRRALLIDAGPLHEILSDPETTRYWHALAHTTREETDAWFQSIFAPEDPKWSDEFIVVHRGRVIGTMGSQRLPWIGFLLNRGDWGRGFATEALTAFTRYMFDRGLPYLYAATDVQNAAARALLSKAGFREVGRSNGVWKVQGKPTHAVHYRLSCDGSEPDLEKQREWIAAMEAEAARLTSGDRDPEQLGDTHADQQPEQQER